MSEYFQVLDDRNRPQWSEQDEFAVDVLVGLSEHPKRVNSRWFYDDRGSELFAKIMDVDAYYPTAKEFEIFEEKPEELLDTVPDRINLVDLGAGDGRKTELLIGHLEARGVDIRYVPIDISAGAMRTLTDRLAKRFPSIEIAGIVSEYVDGLRYLAGISDRTNVTLFLGSNIGNFNKAQARGFLRRLWDALNPDDRVVIGFDMKKDIEVLLNAYNDPEGYTREFNLNLFDRMNRELGANFDREKFRHYGTFNVVTGAMESYLVSLARQSVYVSQLRATFEFSPWEPIHTEYSYKYLESDIDELASFSGYDVEAKVFDSDAWFCDALWRVKKIAG